jgi:hypothetical protein
MNLSDQFRMNLRTVCLAGVIVGAAACAAQSAQVPVSPSPASAWPDRPVRRDLPMAPSFRRGYSMGTRDSSGAPGAKYWQQKVDYRIDAQLDPSTNELRGSETITLHNTTPDTLKRIAMRLYQNYFTASVARNGYITDVTNGIIIERLVVNGAAIDLSDKKQYNLDERVAAVYPRAPIHPGATATIDVAWHFTVPNVDTTARGERMGRWGNYLYQIAQWYPQVAMYDELRGWDLDQYLGEAEFNNQYGSFDVRITAPGGWLLGATGTLENPEEVYSQRTRDRLALAMSSDSTVHVVEASERGSSATASGDRLAWHFTAPLVNDFAFAVSRDYVMDATHANIPTRGKIPVYALYLPQHVNYRTNQTVQFGRKALEQHSNFLFPYEFPQLTIADGPEYGMEYPMILFNSWRLGTTVHEAGHQWFPMMVGSNETRYGFMDEGFNSYIDVAAMSAIQDSVLRRYGPSTGYQRIAGTELEAPMMWLNDYQGPNYGMAAYGKAPVALNAIGGIVGDRAIQQAMSKYARDWKYKHPTPYDFFFSMNKSLGKNFDWFWYEWFFTTYTFDQSVQSVAVEGANVVITVHDKGDMIEPVIARVDFTDGSSQTVTSPVEGWFSGNRTLIVRVPSGGRTVKSVVLDPENRFQDLSRANNTWTR